MNPDDDVTFDLGEHGGDGEIPTDAILAAFAADAEEEGAEAYVLEAVEGEEDYDDATDALNQALGALEEAVQKAKVQSEPTEAPEEEKTEGIGEAVLTPQQLKHLVFGKKPAATTGIAEAIIKPTPQIKVLTPEQLKEFKEKLKGGPLLTADQMTEVKLSISKNPFVDGNPASPPEEEYDPRTSPPTCKFFAAARRIAETNQCVPPDNWAFDGLFAFHGCSSPDMNARGQNGCEMVGAQPSCVFYQPSEGELIESVRQTKTNKMGMPGEVREVAIEENRFNFGTPAYDIAVIEADTAGNFGDNWVTKKRLFKTDYETPEAWLAAAQEAYQEEIANFGPHTTTEALLIIEDDEEPTPQSYLKELVTTSEPS